MKRLTAIGCAVVAVLTLCGAQASTSQPYSKSKQPKLQFIGDSITVMSTRGINARFGKRYNVAIEAHIGHDAFLQQENIARAAALQPAIQVINLGTNDAAHVGKEAIGTINGQRFVLRPAQTIESVLATFDGIVAKFKAVSPETCLIFVNVNTHAAAPANAAKINRHLKKIAPNLVNWNGAWKRSYFDNGSGPHPNTKGKQVLLKLEDRAVKRCQSQADR